MPTKMGREKADVVTIRRATHGPATSLHRDHVMQGGTDVVGHPLAVEVSEVLGDLCITSLERGTSKIGPPLYKEVAGCAIGSARLFGAHVMRAGFVAIYFGFMLVL